LLSPSVCDDRYTHTYIKRTHNIYRKIDAFLLKDPINLKKTEFHHRLLDYTIDHQPMRFFIWDEDTPSYIVNKQLEKNPSAHFDAFFQGYMCYLSVAYPCVTYVTFLQVTKREKKRKKTL
jgi:hypothetical protein